MVNSCQKGKRIERNLAHLLIKYGFVSARRSEQYAGINDDADVVCNETPEIHWECKGTKTISLPKSSLQRWITQVSEVGVAKAARGEPFTQMPVIYWEPNGKEPLCIMHPLVYKYFADTLSLSVVGLDPFNNEAFEIHSELRKLQSNTTFCRTLEIPITEVNVVTVDVYENRPAMFMYATDFLELLGRYYGEKTVAKTIKETHPELN